MLVHPHLLFPLLLVTPFLAAQAQAPTVEQILARHFEARGGLAKIRAIRSLTSTGRIEIGPMVLALRIENPRGAYRSDTTLQGMTKTEAFDGRTGWVVDPFAGSTQAEPMGPSQLRQVELQGDFDGPLVDWQGKGHKVSFAGMAAVNGAEAFTLKAALKNGDELTTFIDAKTFLEVKAVTRVEVGGRAVEVETLIGDYRPVHGVRLPFAFDIQPKDQPQGMRILLEHVEANLPMDAARFKPPSAKRAGANQ